MNKFLVELLLFAFGLLMFFGMPYLIRRRLRSGRPSTTLRPIIDDGAGGREVPLVATFGGIRGLPWIGFATNNLNPKLVIGPTGITYRVLRLQTRAFNEVEQVDIRVFGATVNLVFMFRDCHSTFEANVGSIILATETLAILSANVTLSDRAKRIMVG
jgi:hypothetical protein